MHSGFLAYVCETRVEADRQCVARDQDSLDALAGILLVETPRAFGHAIRAGLNNDVIAGSGARLQDAGTGNNTEANGGASHWKRPVGNAGLEWLRKSRAWSGLLAVAAHVMQLSQPG